MIGVSTKVLVQMYIHAGVKYASKNTNIFPLGKLLIFAAKKLLILILILILSLFQHSAISPSFFTRSSIGANTNICDVCPIFADWNITLLSCRICYCACVGVT